MWRRSLRRNNLLSHAELTAAAKADLKTSPLQAKQKSILLHHRELFQEKGTSSSPREKAESNTACKALVPRRWSRGADETCVAAVRKTRGELNAFAVTYRWSDAHWKGLLNLPCSDPVGLELKSRHCNYALKHLGQRGHALYCIERVVNSVLHPRGLIERSFVETANAKKGERLVTNILHEGPLDGRGDGRDGERGIVAVSRVQGVGTAFHRPTMLWQRSRRIGALQAEVGAMNWVLHDPVEVGKRDSGEVMLLDPHTQRVGGGLTTLSIASSFRIARHPYLYVCEFEAPSSTVMDAVHQACHLLARDHRLVRSDGSEQLHLLGSSISSRHPFLPIEVDLHFRVQLSRPQVLRNRNEFPSSLIGSPLVEGAPIFVVEFCVTQGAEHYLYDENPVCRPMRWWNQKDNMAYAGHLYFCRSGNLDKLKSFEFFSNPFEASVSRWPKTPVPDMLADEPGDEKDEEQEQADVLDQKALWESTTPLREHFASKSREFSTMIPPNDKARARMRAMTAALERQKREEKGPSTTSS